MHSLVLSQIEETIDHLSHEEQLWLIEQLAAMATDPEIRAELQKIDREFAVTEADGLESK